MDHGDHDMPMGGGDAPFCKLSSMGGGTVMRMGFEPHSSGLTCVTFLFVDWVLDSEVKYAFGIIGAFLMGLSNELLARSRVKLAQYLSAPRPGASCCSAPGPSLVESYPIPCRVALGGLHGLQMVLAYWMMLLVMLYDPCIFSGLVVGLALGYGLFSTTFQSMKDTAKNAHRQAALKQQQPQMGGAKSLAGDASDPESVALKSASGYVDGGASGEVDQMIKMDALAAASSGPPDGADVAAAGEEGVELVLRVNTVPANAPCCGGTA